MKLSKKGEYALRAMLDLTMAHELGRPLVPITALAEAQRIPGSFLEQILIELRQAGLLASTRGKYGGYSLARPAETIPIGEIVRLIDGPLAPISCASVTAYQRCSCPDEEHCGLRLLMIDVRNAIAQIVDHCTLRQLAGITLERLRRDGLTPPVVELIRHLPLAARKPAAAPAPAPEPEFFI